MSPKEAREIYYEARRADPEWNVVAEPIKCEAIELRAWQAVIDAVRREVDLEIAVKLAAKIQEDARKLEVRDETTGVVWHG